MTIKLKYLIPLLLLIISGCIFFYLYTAKYSLREITADNFKEKLKPKDELSRIEAYKLTLSIPDNSDYRTNFDFCNSRNLADGENNLFKISHSTYNDMYFVAFESNLTNLGYQGNWKKKNDYVLFSCTVRWYKATRDWDPQYKTIVDKLILKHGYNLSESKLKSGFDILIKEIDNAFIIIEIGGYYANNHIVSLMMSAFSKSKYF